MKDERIGFYYAIAAAFCYSTMTIFVKLAHEVSPGMLIFFRNLICLILLFPNFIKSKTGFKQEQKLLFLIRNFCGFLALSSFYIAAKNLFLMDAVLLTNTAPLFIPIIVRAWGGVKLSKLQALAIGVGILGVCIVLKPKFDFFNFYGLVGLFSGAMIALSKVMTRKLSATEPYLRILFYFFLYNTFFGIAPMVYSWKKIENPMMWVYIALVGGIAFVFQFFSTQSYVYTAATKVSVIGYFSIIFSGIYGFFVFKNVPGVFSFLGVGFIVLGGVLILLSDKKEKKLKRC